MGNRFRSNSEPDGPKVLDGTVKDEEHGKPATDNRPRANLMTTATKVQSHRDLIVWQRAVEMTVALYRLTTEFPREEIYGLASQLRRAGVSVASNIAEGYGRASRGEYRQFLGIARGSNLELQTQLVIARALNVGEGRKIDAIEGLSSEVGKMLTVMMRRLSPEAGNSQ